MKELWSKMSQDEMEEFIKRLPYKDLVHIQLWIAERIASDFDNCKIVTWEE